MGVGRVDLEVGNAHRVGIGWRNVPWTHCNIQYAQLTYKKYKKATKRIKTHKKWDTTHC